MDSKIAEIALNIFTALTWKRLAQLAVLLLLVAGGVVFWINRDYISGAIRPAKLSPEPVELVVSDKGKAAIDEALKKASASINTISVVRMNLERNSRRVIYFASIDPEIIRQNDEFLRTHATPDIPVFNDDAENNHRIIQYINSEFVCVPFSASQAARYLHDVQVATICGTAVPPIYGKFRGTVLAFVKYVPNEDQKLQLRILLRELANQLDNPSSN
jgi:hypothetical protein